MKSGYNSTIVRVTRGYISRISVSEKPSASSRRLKQSIYIRRSPKMSLPHCDRWSITAAIRPAMWTSSWESSFPAISIARTCFVQSVMNSEVVSPFMAVTKLSPPVSKSCGQNLSVRTPPFSMGALTERCFTLPWITPVNLNSCNFMIFQVFWIFNAMFHSPSLVR